MKNWAQILTIVLLTVIVLVGCGGKDKRESVKSTNRNGRTTTSDTRVTNGKGTISTTQEKIDALISVEGSPEDLIGRIGISGTSVTFRGYADVASSESGIIDAAGLEIIINDEWVVNKSQKPYIVPFSNLHEGRIYSNGSQDEVVLTFYDEHYGQWLIMEGVAAHSKSGNFTGRIYFNNESSGLVTNGEVELGTFTIPVCSFFKCK